MKIILNADDFGCDDDTVRATIECFERGALTSATIMPKMPATQSAIDYANSHPQFSFGVHLTFSSDGPERPVLPASDVPHMVQEDGRLLPTHIMRTKALKGAVPVDEIARECAAQINYLKSQGLMISHVDSHGHLHKIGPFRKAIERALPGLDIKRVRLPQDVYIHKRLTSPNLWFGPFWRWRIRRQFVTTDHLYMPTSVRETGWTDQILSRLPNLRGEFLEVGVHPGYVEPWRDAERIAIQTFAQRCREQHYELIGWNSIPA